MLLIAGPDMATVVQPGYTLLDSYTNLTEGSVVVVGRVIDVHNVEIERHQGQVRVYPEIEIDIEECLYGGVTGTIKILGLNTFVHQNGQWLIRATGGAPWLVPGDRVLVKARQSELKSTTLGLTLFYRLRTASFLLDSQPLVENQLYEYTGFAPSVDLQDKAGVLTPVGILESAKRNAIPLELTIADILRSIRASK